MRAQNADIDHSLASLDLGAFRDYGDAAPDVWTGELSECMEQIVQRSRNKRNTAEAREEQLAIYASILRAQYAADEVQPKIDELVPALVKCFRSGVGEHEAVYAMKALAVTNVTTGEDLFHEVQQPIKTRMQDTSSELAQATAINVLGTATFFGGADLDETEDIMDFLLDIERSDGESVGSVDSGPVVTAALQEWAFLATQFPNMDGKSEDPISVFEEQLDSSILSVQMAAGEAIALLYEKSYTPRSDDEDDGEGDDSGEDDGETDPDEFETGAFQRRRWAYRYDAYGGDMRGLKSKLAELSRASGRHIAKDKRKDLHRAFTDVLHTVEHPWRGPKYSTALNADATGYMGHRLFVRSGRAVLLAINRWWMFHRYEALKRVLASGFVEHFQANKVVAQAIPAGALEAPTSF